MKSPFPWFGGKSRVAQLVWDRFGDVPNYVEPFFGSGAVLLARPHAAKTETVNDKDCMVANFWRALHSKPDEVAHYADWPVNEADQHARHLWLCSREEFRERMKTDQEYFDTRIAGYWVWGQCIWIGAGWCSVELKDGEGELGRQLPHLGDAGKGINRPSQQLPSLSSDGMGVHRKRPQLGNSGTGINRKLPHLGDGGKGLNRQRSHLFFGVGLNRKSQLSQQMPSVINDGVGVHAAGRGDITAYMFDLAERLRRVRVCCGDWSRVCGPSVTFKHGITGVFLDPPYSDEAGRDMDLYAHDSGSVAHEVRTWALEAGNHPNMRIALCGYEGEHAMPDSWDCVAWKTGGGYGSQGEDRGRANSGRERIWFSPACLNEPPLWRLANEAAELEAAEAPATWSPLMGTAMRDADEAAEHYLRGATPE